MMFQMLSILPHKNPMFRMLLSMLPHKKNPKSLFCDHCTVVGSSTASRNRTKNVREKVYWRYTRVALLHLGRRHSLRPLRGLTVSAHVSQTRRNKVMCCHNAIQQYTLLNLLNAHFYHFFFEPPLLVLLSFTPVYRSLVYIPGARNEHAMNDPRKNGAKNRRRGVSFVRRGHKQGYSS